MTPGCARRSPSLTLVQALLPSAELASHVNAAFRAGHEGTALLPPLVTGIEGKAVAVPLQLMQACGMQDGSVVLVGDAAHAVRAVLLAAHAAMRVVCAMKVSRCTLRSTPPQPGAAERSRRPVGEARGVLYGSTPTCGVAS